jgi:hypothetical protein
VERGKARGLCSAIKNCSPKCKKWSATCMRELRMCISK